MNDFKKFLKNKLLNSILKENTHLDYLKWKRKNVSYRGVKELGEENSGMAKYGSGLYTAALSNKVMAREYGKVYFVVNAVPKNPKIVSDTNQGEMFLQNLVTNFCLSHNVPRSNSFFDKNTTIAKEIIKMGYDGLIIKGREMVNYMPPENVLYFNTEEEVKSYYERQRQN